MMTTIISDYKRDHTETSFQLSQDEDDDNWDIRISSVYDRMNTIHEDTVLSEKIMVAVPRESHFSEGESLRLEDIKHECADGLRHRRCWNSDRCIGQF